MGRLNVRDKDRECVCDGDGMHAILCVCLFNVQFMHV